MECARDLWRGGEVGARPGVRRRLLEPEGEGDPDPGAGAAYMNGASHFRSMFTPCPFPIIPVTGERLSLFPHPAKAVRTQNLMLPLRATGGPRALPAYTLLWPLLVRLTLPIRGIGAPGLLPTPQFTLPLTPNVLLLLQHAQSVPRHTPVLTQARPSTLL